MTASEERKLLIDGAAALQADLQKFTARINAVINKLIGEADSLKLAAADEHNNAETVKVTKVKFSRAAPENDQVGVPSQGPSLGKGKRACSVCRQPGHRAQNCPQAHIKYAQERAKDGDYDNAREADAMASSLSHRQGKRLKKKKKGKK